jgi:hypothetical protein
MSESRAGEWTFSGISANQYVTSRALITQFLDPDLNRSRLSVALYLRKSSQSSQASIGVPSFNLWVNGPNVGTYGGSSVTLNPNDVWVYFGSIDTYVDHNEDGSKFASFEIEGNLGTSSVHLRAGYEAPGNVPDLYGSFWLTANPRKSDFWCTNTGTIYVGTTMNFYIDRKSSNFSHKMFYEASNVSMTQIATGIGTTYQWAPPSSLYALYPNDSMVQIKIRVETFNGATSLGYYEHLYNVYIQNDGVTISDCSVVDGNALTLALTGNSANFIPQFSTGNVTCKGTPKNGATIAKVEVLGSTGNVIDLVNFTGSGQKTYASSTYPYFDRFSLTFKWTDSRGFFSSYTKEINILNYNRPFIKTLVLSREDTIGTDMLVTITGDWTQTNFGAYTNDFLTAQLSYCELLSGGPDWENETVVSGFDKNDLTIDADSFEVTDFVVANIDPLKKYVFRLSMIDRVLNAFLLSNYKDIILPISMPIIDIGEHDVNIGGNFTAKNMQSACIGPYTIETPGNSLIHTITLPIEYADESYICLITPEIDYPERIVWSISDKTTTGFKITIKNVHTSSVSVRYCWLAFGTISFD